MTTREQFIRQQIQDRRGGGVLCPAVSPAPDFAPFHVGTPYRETGKLWSLGYHTGEDHPCPVGSLAVATAWGTIVAAGDNGAGYGADYGTVVVVRSRSGWDAMFCHLSKIEVRLGEKVVPGQVVGLTGESGHVSGPHLHFEVRPAGGRFGSDVRPINVKQKGHTP